MAENTLCLAVAVRDIEWKSNEIHHTHATTVVCCESQTNETIYIYVSFPFWPLRRCPHLVDYLAPISQLGKLNSVETRTIFTRAQFMSQTRFMWQAHHTHTHTRLTSSCIVNAKFTHFAIELDDEFCALSMIWWLATIRVQIGACLSGITTEELINGKWAKKFNFLFRNKRMRSIAKEESHLHRFIWIHRFWTPIEPNWFR